MPTDMQTVTTTTDYQVAPSDQLVFTNQLAFHLSQRILSGGAVAPPPHLTISGEVDVVMTSQAASGGTGLDGIVIDNTFNNGPGPLVSLDPGATLKVSVTGGAAYGYVGGGSAPATFANAGAVIVSADGSAGGLEDSSDGLINNSGQVTVTSATSDATGLKVEGAGHVENSGTVSVTGHGQVTGVDMGPAGSGEVFHNSGTIVAQDDSATQTSVGVYWAGQPEPGAADSFVNDGTISAERALEIYSGTAAENLIVNNGHLIGEVWLGGSAPVTLLNNGVIDGAVRMIGVGTIYDGRMGAALGPIIASNNGGDILLGGAGAETMDGGLGNDTISGGGGADLIDGGGGYNQLDGGSAMSTLTFASVGASVQVDLAAGTASTFNGGDAFTGFSRIMGGPSGDTISGGGSGADYLHGGGGDDAILGGAGFDDINGNQGNDTIDGGSGGADWLVGGQGNDLITAHTSGNILYGNLGDDTLHGGTGGDIIRGGRGDDSIVAGSGAEWISGDRGNDTIQGGSGPDIFHSSRGAGLDLIYGFDAAKGDHVQLDPGAAYTVSQEGIGTVIDMGHGDQVILYGVEASSLPAGWILEA